MSFIHQNDLIVGETFLGINQIWITRIISPDCGPGRLGPGNWALPSFGSGQK